MSLPTDRLCFYSGSRDVTAGNGTREQVADPAAYSQLSAFRHWRRVLSNFHESEFEYEGLRYRTVEHAFQAAKIATVNPGKAQEFALESGSELSRGNGLAARRARKMVVLSSPEIAAWDAQSRRAMMRIARAKYAQCPAACDVLSATGRAQLHHILPRRLDMDRFVHLEKLRDEELAIGGRGCARDDAE